MSGLTQSLNNQTCACSVTKQKGETLQIYVAALNHWEHEWKKKKACSADVHLQGLL